ncbi:hypothetical protein [Actinoplanes sp. GCM10030250]|uniref:hypothetical protein n=1 Tax=Actinoplanes sp. GCM10030250 TaxID=3273376 RepID=UPI00361FDF55
MTEPEQPQSPTGRMLTTGDMAVLLGVLALVLFVPATALAAAVQPVPPHSGLVAQPRPANASAAVLRPLPDGRPGGIGIGILEPVAAAALGTAGARDLLTLLKNESHLQDATPRDNDGKGIYPYRYVAITRLLDRAPGAGRTEEAARLGAGLMSVAGQPAGSRFDSVRSNAAAASFAVLERARGTGGCTAQLNLLLLVAADMLPRDRVVRDEAGRAERACPGDPTPLWLYGQYLSQRAARVIEFDVGDPIPADATEQSEAVFARLAEQFPGSVPALTGVADGHLRAGLRLTRSRPFTARHHLRTAAEHYLAARDVDPGSAVPGLIAALTALGEPDRAAALAGEAAATARRPGPLLELLTTAQEAGHHFDRAEATGRELAARGAAAYPTGDLLFPQPGNMEETLDQDPSGPLSAGAVTHVPFTVDLQVIPGGAGGAVDDTSFVPAYRSGGGLVGPDPDCPDLGWRRDALLAGHNEAAAAGLPDPGGWQFSAARPGGACRLRADVLHDVIHLETGRPVEPSRREWVGDEWQNVFRWAGDLPRAEKAARAWVNGGDPAASLPMLRLAEVLFLQGRHEEAAGAFAAAARRTRAEQWDNDLGVDQARLGQGAALLRTSRAAEGRALLLDIAESSERGTAYQRQEGKPGWATGEVARGFAVVAYHARAQIADADREAGALRAAAENYAAARELLPHLDVQDPASLRADRLDANQALAELGLGDFTAAAGTAARALSADPRNPAFLMTAGFAADRAGLYRTAARYDTDALAADPGAYPAANDLGVAYARLGRHDEAIDALRRAVGARRDYALGWFNLGVVHAERGPLHFLAAQGALARAFDLDESLRDAPREPTTDIRTYKTGIDLSKPVPPRWSLAGLPPGSPAPATGLLAVLVLGLTLARAAGAGAQSSAQQWLENLVDHVDRLLPLNRLRHPAWALAATVLVFVVSALLRSRDSVTETMVLALGVSLLATVVLRARALAARRAGAVAEQQSWGPGLAFGAVTAAFAPWAPLPVTRPASAAPRVHTAAPITVGLIGLLLFLETAAFGVPVIRALATAALVMVASVLVPVTPLDGAQLSKAGLVAGAGVLGAAVLMGLALA